MFGAPSANRFGSTLFLYVESFIVSPAVDADVVGGNGKISLRCCSWGSERNQRTD